MFQFKHILYAFIGCLLFFLERMNFIVFVFSKLLDTVYLRLVPFICIKCHFSERPVVIRVQNCFVLSLRGKNKGQMTS